MIARRLSRHGSASHRRPLDFTPPECPGCGATLPLLRLPDSLRQALLGGWTCEDCGCVMDRDGRRFDEPPRVRRA